VRAKPGKARAGATRTRTRVRLGHGREEGDDRWVPLVGGCGRGGAEQWAGGAAGLAGPRCDTGQPRWTRLRKQGAAVNIC
jgi:hypothetical protein